MKLRVDRYASDVESTIGRLYVDDVFECYTLEDQERTGAKVAGETRIPAGSYQLRLRSDGGKNQEYSAYYAKWRDWHKGMLHLQDVPDFQYVLIHVGNFDTDTEGCLLVGAQPGIDAKGHHDVLDSRKAYERLYPKVRDRLLAGETVTIDVNNFPQTQVPAVPAPGSRPGVAAAGTVIAGGVVAAGAAINAANNAAQPETSAPPAPASTATTPASTVTAPASTTTTPAPVPTPPPAAHTETPASSSPFAHQQQILTWGLVVVGAVIVLLGLYLLIHRFRDWRHRVDR